MWRGHACPLVDEVLFVRINPRIEICCIHRPGKWSNNPLARRNEIRLQTAIGRWPDAAERGNVLSPIGGASVKVLRTIARPSPLSDIRSDCNGAIGRPRHGNGFVVVCSSNGDRRLTDCPRDKPAIVRFSNSVGIRERDGPASMRRRVTGVGIMYIQRDIPMAIDCRTRIVREINCPVSGRRGDVPI